MLVYAVKGCTGVKRDMDLLREVLLKVEENPETDGTREFMYDSPEEMGIYGHSCEEVAYQIAELIEAGLLKGAITGGFPMHIISRLTWDGHEFLDSIRDLGIWERVKGRMAGLPSITLKAVAAIAEAELKKHLGLT